MMFNSADLLPFYLKNAGCQLFIVVAMVLASSSLALANCDYSDGGVDECVCETCQVNQLERITTMSCDLGGGKSKNCVWDTGNTSTCKCTEGYGAPVRLGEDSLTLDDLLYFAIDESTDR